MRLLNHKLYPINFALNIAKEVSNNTDITFASILDAPKIIKLLSFGRYCAYKNVIYVPTFHFSLVSSKHDEDRTIATAKLLPWIMLLHDVKRVSFFTFLKSLYSLKYQIHYFLYEFGFLLALNHKFLETIAVGFMTTRYNLLTCHRLTYDEVLAHMTEILRKNSAL